MCLRRVAGQGQALQRSFRSVSQRLPNVLYTNIVEALAKEGKSLDRSRFDHRWNSAKVGQHGFLNVDNPRREDMDKGWGYLVPFVLRMLVDEGMSQETAEEESVRIARLLLTPQVTSPPTPLQQLKSFCNQGLLDTYGFNVITSNADVVIDREKRRTDKVRIIPTPELNRLIAALESHKNAVVQGCSGIGKTVAMLHAGGSKPHGSGNNVAEHVCFYVTESGLEEHFSKAESLLKLHPEALAMEDKSSHSDEKARGAFRARRSTMIATSIALALASATKTSGTLVFEVLRNLDVKVVLTVCVDEAGRDAFTVPSMTQITNEQMKSAFNLIATDLGFTFDVSRNVTFRFVVGGTGIGSANRPDGSLPDSFARVVLSPVPDDALLKEALYGSLLDKDLAGKVYAMIQDEPMLHAATRNSRLAVLLAAEVEKRAKLIAWFGANEWDKCFRSGQLVVKGGVPRVMLLDCFYAAALEFKDANGLCALTGCSAVASVLSRALRAHFFPACHGFDETTVGRLVRRYGVLVDRSAWYPESQVSDGEGDEIVWLTGTEEARSGMRLGAPQTGRYDFAESLKAILQLLMWGERPLASTSTGRELELATQSAMALLVMACRRQAEFQHLICSPKPTFKRFDDDLVFHGTNSVLVLTQLSNNSYNVADARRLADNGVVSATCVALSKPLSPFAAVTVLFGDHAYLVQCKDTKEELCALRQGAELFKMGFECEKPAFVAAKCTVEQVLEVADELGPDAREKLKACITEKKKRLADLHMFLETNPEALDSLYAKIGSKRGNVAQLVRKHTNVSFTHTIKKRVGVFVYSGKVAGQTSPHRQGALEFNLNDLVPLLPRHITVDDTVMCRRI